MNRLSLFSALLWVLVCCDAIAQQTYAIPGTYTWTVPPCVTEVTVKAWGAGGGGGAAWVKMDNNATSTFGDALEACAGGGGGGGGGFSQATYTVVPGQTYTIIVGAGGTGGTANATPLNPSAITDGQNGGLSSFSGNSQNLVANGGNGGQKAFSYNAGWPSNHLRTGGAGGTGGTGNLYTGGNGSAGTGGGSFDHSGAGGGGAGSNGNGGAANATTIPHRGGTGAAGAGNGGDGRNITSGKEDGRNATGLAGGGSAGVAHTTGYVNPAIRAIGGNGGDGQVIIEYLSSGTLPAQPSPIVGNTNIPCGGGAESYSVTNVSGITYTWTYSGSGNISGSGNAITLTPTTGGVLTVVPAGECGNGPAQTITITMDPPPAQPSAITGNTSLPCGGGQNAYSVTNIPGVTYTWTYSGTGTITGTGASIVLDAITGGVLTVTPSNTCGGGAPQTITLTMGSSPTISSITGNTILPCGGGSEIYSVTDIPGVTYTWAYSGVGTVSGSGSSVTLVAISGGILSVTPSDACGAGVPETITITMDGAPAQPSPIVGNPNLPCGGGTEVYSVTEVPGVTYTWAYTGTGTITGSGSSITLVATSGGTLAVVPSDNCGNGTPQTITLSMGNISVNITQVIQPSCGGTDGSATAQASGGSGPYAYSWSPSGGNDAVASGLMGGAHTVTVTDANQCTASESIILAGADGPTVILSDIQHVSCANDNNGSIQISITGGNSPYTIYLNGVLVNGTTIGLLPAGDYEIVVTDDNGCSSNRITATITQPGTVFSDSTYYQIRLGDYIHINSQIGGTVNLTYGWYPPYNISCIDCPDPLVWPARTTTYRLNVTNSGGCSEESVVYVEVYHDGPFVPNAFTPGVDNINDVWYISDYGVKTVDIRIFDRWGIQLFQTDNIYKGWTGKRPNGEPYPIGVYVYKANIRYIDGEEKDLTGRVAIVR